ncbi:NTP transferase domain-containing protein [Demequina sp.]|uniref:nucleotidyltransferase family protein n=1 Tax=Demequina sp. TaxID=2050685 RepID=UPI0025D3BCBE|nr:NTP transferase domain-containing protein [Demequina sp.]
MSKSLAGVVLAAGAGARYGGPKALARDHLGAWLPRACALLAGAGCDPVIAVLGARTDDAAALLPRDVAGVVAEDWASGIGASLRAGLEAALDAGAGAVLVTLVDLPGLAPEAVGRVAALWRGDDAVLARAVDAGVPGHPVLLGAAHVRALMPTLDGDTGAGPYLAEHGAQQVDCTGLGAAADVDG